jgi:5-methylcytosine-specific restriction endonuclease McrA
MSDDLIGYAEASRLLYPGEDLHTTVARVRRLALDGTLQRSHNPTPNGDVRGAWLVSRSEIECLIANGGAVLRPGGRPPKVPSVCNVARLIEVIKQQLAQSPPRPLQVSYVREILIVLETVQAQLHVVSVPSATQKPRIHRATSERERLSRIISSNNSRARRRGIPGKIRVSEWIELCEQHNNCCAFCGQEVSLTIDHIVPLSKGGANTIDNLQPLCWPCNSRKRNN